VRLRSRITNDLDGISCGNPFHDLHHHDAATVNHDHH